MKNIFRLENISITIEGTPVELNGLTIENESSVQELATSGGLIKQLIAELKPIIQEATKPPVKVVERVEPKSEPVVRRVEKVEPIKCAKVSTVNSEPKNLSKCFREIEIPEGLKPTGFKTWEWKSQETIPDKIVNVKASELDHVMVSLKAGETWVHVHVRPDNTRIVGVSPETITEFLAFAELPDEIREYIEKVIAI